MTRTSMGIPARMRAVEVAGLGGPEVLRVADRPVPVPAEEEILVRVAAAGVNRVDVFQRTGLYYPPPRTTDIPGVELAGEVVACGPKTRRYRVGDYVACLVVGGGYAEYCTVPEGQALPLPGGYDLLRAAALPETFCTVWAGLWGQGRLAPGESLLVHGGSSGIGTTAIMLASALGAGDIFTTAGSAEKCAACVKLGAKRAINYREEDFVEVVRAATGGRGVDVVLDIVAGDYIPRSLSVMAEDGRLVLVGRMSQEMDVHFHVQRVMYSRLVITGVSLRGQSVARKTAYLRDVERQAWPHLSSGRIAPVIHAVFPLERADEAHRLLESSAHIGKVMLDVTR